ncbi:MAG: hypothetical protein JXA20_06880 [Spirochaetes bacterium]|nr:hypothetical protein [Spirochaetota bacterium]
MGDETIRRIHGIYLVFNILKLAAWVVFLLLFAPVCMANGLYGAALFLSCLGLFIDLMIFRKGILPMDKENQRLLARFFMVEHCLLAAAAIFMMLRPVDGGWARLPGTHDWSDPALVSMGRGRFAAFVSVGGARRVFVTENRGAAWSDTGYPDGFGWGIHYQEARDEIWIVPRRATVVYRLHRDAGRWEEFVRPPGDNPATAMTGERFFLAAAGRLYEYFRDQDRWSLFTRAGFPVREVAAAPWAGGSSVLITGREWMENDAKGRWRYIRPAGIIVTWPYAAAGGGWRYVFQGGMLTGTLYAAAPGEGFVERRAPAPDLRILAVNPSDGSEVWAGTWGQGVFRSTDGGASWRYRGLRGIQVRSLAVDFGEGTALAGSSNLIFQRGLFLLRFGPIEVGKSDQKVR